jgi:hypothetical protein
MDALLAPPHDDTSAGSRHSWKTHALRALIWCSLAVIFWVAAVQGLHLRWWVYQISDPIRFVGDSQRGVYWGLEASGPEGYLNQFDKMDPQVPEWQDPRWVPWLDYGPLRMLVMRQWAQWLRDHHHIDPRRAMMDQWQRPYWFAAPVLHFNEVLEAFSAVCAFFLTRLWVLRGTAGEKHGPLHGIWQGAVAALLIWFSADIIISAHGWPQWDSWPVPFYLCACLLASFDWWFAAGIAVAVGVSLKGQMLSISPIFIIWPLVMGKPGAALRWINGALFATAAIATGWLITYLPPDRLQAARDVQDVLPVDQYPPNLFAIPRIIDVAASAWIAAMLLIVNIVPWLLRRPWDALRDALRDLRRLWIAGAAVAVFAAVYWPWLLPRNRAIWYCGVLAASGVTAATLLLRPRNQPYLWAAVIGGGLLSCIALFHGSAAWWDCAIRYGSAHWPYMVTGPASNIPAYFELRFGWEHRADQLAFTIPALAGHWPGFLAANSWWPAADLNVTAKMLFDTIYAIMLALSGIAIGLQARRNDRRMLVALVTPWIMFFLIPVQIQERYLLYASGAAACCIGDSVGAALLGILMSLLSAVMHLTCMMDRNEAELGRFGDNLSRAFPHLFSPTAGQTMLQYFHAMDPDMAWAVLVIGLVFMYLSLTRSRRTT